MSDGLSTMVISNSRISRPEASSNRRTDMKLISINCGLPREVGWHGTKVTTSIYKQPVKGRVVLRTLNLDGDKQSDLTVHGGEHKAVYCYPIEHYDYWKAELPGQPLPTGVFGENFTIEGLNENSVHIGAILRLGLGGVSPASRDFPVTSSAFGSNRMTWSSGSSRAGVQDSILR